MAQDPRKFLEQDPRKFLVLSNASPNCNARHIAAIDNPKKTFYDTIKNISDIEVTGKVGAGLRNIVAIVESGDGRFWDTQSVLDETTIGSKTNWDTMYRMVNPSVINSGIGAAKRVADAANNKNFTIQDIPEVIQELSVLKGAVDAIFIPTTATESLRSRCAATNYAQDLINFSPKFKFNFVVQFNTAEPFRQYMEPNNDAVKTAAFAKTFERPTVTFEHEDVNMYGFRTKVLKNIQYAPITITLYDDSKNRVMKYFSNYLKIISPIANQTVSTRKSYEQSGLATESLTRSTSMRALDDNISTALGVQGTAGTKTILDEVILYHVYHNGEFFNAYHFINPKIIELQFDELTMEESNVTMVTIQLGYDAMFIDNEISTSQDTLSNGTSSAKEMTAASNMGRSKIQNRESGAQSSLSFEDILLYEQVAAQENKGTSAEQAKDNGLLRNLFEPTIKTYNNVFK